MSTQAEFFTLVTEHLCLDSDRLAGEDAAALKPVADLGADSLDNVELTMAAEDHFVIAIADDEANELAEDDKPLSAWVELIDAKLAAKTAPAAA